MKDKLLKDSLFWNGIICGNITELEQVEESSYGFFGKSIPCVILNTINSKEIELDDDEIIDFIKSE